MTVGWKLAEEIAVTRPEHPGPEWWTLLDIALDARDGTRQSMCGHQYLTARGKCSRRTVYRRLKALADAGLIRVARKSAPGVRAIYEVISSPVGNPSRLPVDNDLRVTAFVAPDDPVDNPERVPAFVTPERVPKMALTGASSVGHHPVTTTAPSQTNGCPVITPSVEGRLSTGAWTAPGYAICAGCGGREHAGSLVDGRCMFCTQEMS